jgi:propionyl-CoA carboxylase beta subunit
MTDFILMVKDTSYMFVTGPNVVKTVTHEDVNFETLGGAMVHNSVSGVAHFALDSEEECLMTIRRLFGYMPSNNLDDPPFVPNDDPPSRMEDDLDTIVPDVPTKGYDMKKVIALIVDKGEFLEVQEHFAGNMIVGFARLAGMPVGIVGQQPLMLAGVLDIDSSDKAARFVRFCDCFNIPLVTFVDVPGFLPGVKQEHGGIIRHGAKLLYAYCEATVPKVTIITRKAYGGAYDVMSSKHVRGDINYAWPSAEVAVMGVDAAVNIIFKDQIENSPDPEETRKRLVADYVAKFANPYVPAARGFIDDVIEPRQTRPKLIAALQMLRNKRDTVPPKKHGNIPL